ncbi:MFS transporter [Desulfonema magnum]|nr:major facilitator superfamily domain-containing protein 6 [Desulfonema magnum]
MDKNNKGAFKFIISSQYFLYFGVLGIFLPYFNLYCYHLGFSGFQIGVLSALRSAVMVLFSLIWGGLADRFQIRKPIYILCTFTSTLIWIFYLFTDNFYLMLIITVCYTIFYGPVISFMEAFSMDILGREKKSYGRVRAWGTIAFIMIVTVFGKIIDLYSVKIILLPIFIGSLAQALFALRIPNITMVRKNSFIAGAKSLFKKRVVIFLICAFLMLMSHGTYYGFFSIHLETLGYGKVFIGMSWALASVAEIVVMISSDKIFRRFSIQNVLLFSFMVAALRWFLLCWAESPAVILISQILHAVTYGTFHIASILYIDLLSPDEAKTTGQVINNAVSYGLGMMAGFFFNGYLYEHLSSFVLFAISSLIALGGGVLLSAFYHKSGVQK